MSDEILNQQLDEIANRPDTKPDFVEMGNAWVPPKDEEKTYSAEEGGIREAAKDVAEKRRDSLPEVERTYLDVHTGEKMPDNQSISLDRAATDIQRIRSQEQQADDDVTKQALATGVDLLRAGWTPEQIQQLAQGQIEQQQQPQAEQPAQPDIAPQPVSDLPPEMQQLAEELDRSPRLKQALHEEAHKIQAAHQAAEQTKAQYTAATRQAFDFAVQSMIAAIPAFQGLTVEQLPAALQVLQRTDPQQHAAAVQHLARVDQLGRASQEAQARQQQQRAAQVRDWAIAQDRAMDDYLAKNESPEVVRSVKEGLPKVLQAYGIDPKEFGQVVSQVPMFRSAQVQRMLFDLCKTHVLRDQVESKKHVPVPNVMRPGTSMPRASYSDLEVKSLSKQLDRSGDVKDAARLLLAKRAARS